MEKREELVVFRLKSSDSKCDSCGEELGKGGYLRKVGDRGFCMECADLGDLVFLAAGDTALTRRASKYSPLRAIVVEWSRARKRYERQGVLVDPEALRRAEDECIADEGERATRRAIAALGRERVDEAYVADFARRIRVAYPSAPAGREAEIAAHACRKSSGRVGRSAAAKSFDREMIDLAVAAHIRHRETGYDRLLAESQERDEARRAVRPIVDRILDEWRGNG